MDRKREVDQRGGISVGQGIYTRACRGKVSEQWINFCEDKM